MKIRIIRNTVVKGKVVEAGEVIDTDDQTARLLMNMNKAVLQETSNEEKKGEVSKKR